MASSGKKLLGGVLIVLGLSFAIWHQTGGCGGTPSEEAAPLPVTFLPERPLRWAVVKDLEKLGQVIAYLEKTKIAELSAVAVGQLDASSVIAALVQQLGFDPRAREGFAKVGVEGSRGFALAEDEGVQLVTLGVKDSTKFDEYMAVIAERFPGAKKDGKTLTDPSGVQADKTISVYSLEDRSVLAYAVERGIAIVAVSDASVNALSRSLFRPRAQSLEKSAAFQQTVKELGERDVYLSGAIPLSPRGKVSLGISVSQAGLSLRALLPKESPPLAPSSPAVANKNFLPHLPESTFLTVEVSGDPRSLRPLFDTLLPRFVGKRLQKAGFDLEGDILAHVHPGAVLGVGLVPDINLSGGLPAELETFNPFHFVNLTLYAQVKDPSIAQTQLSRVALASTIFRMGIETVEEEGAKVYTATYTAGEGMTWGLIGDVLVATGGRGQFGKARARLSSPSPPFVSGKSLAGALALHLEMPKLTSALRAIPESAYGVGGFRIKEVTERFVSMLDELAGISVSFSLDPEGRFVMDGTLGMKHP